MTLLFAYADPECARLRLTPEPCELSDEQLCSRWRAGANDAPDELVIVEVQLGGYTGEDDIPGLRDDDGRC